VDKDKRFGDSFHRGFREERRSKMHKTPNNYRLSEEKRASLREQRKAKNKSKKRNKGGQG
jgi:hypothetical protein